MFWRRYVLLWIWLLLFILHCWYITVYSVSSSHSQLIMRGQSHLVAVWQFYRVTNRPVAFQICRVSNWSNGYHKLTVRGDVAVCRRWAWPVYPAERRVVYSEWVWGGVRSVEQQRLEAQYPLRRSNSAVPHWGRHIGTTRHVLHLLRMLQRRFCGIQTERW